MRNRNSQANACREKEQRAKLLKESQLRNVRSRLTSKTRQKQKESQRDKTLHSIRQEQTQEKELTMFDFLFSFGGLC